MTAMTNNPIAPYQVRRLAFEYEERPGTYKERPVIVGAVDETVAVVLLVKVTGHGPRREYPGEVWLEDWRSEGLTKPSTARCSKTVEVDVSDVEMSPMLGSLSERDAQAVRQGLLDAGKISL